MDSDKINLYFLDLFLNYNNKGLNYLCLQYVLVSILLLTSDGV